MTGKRVLYLQEQYINFIFDKNVKYKIWVNLEI